MTLRQIVAVVRTSLLDQVLEHLRAIGVHSATVDPVDGMTTHPVRDAASYFGTLVSHSRLVLYADAPRVDQIVEVILASGSTGEHGDGLVAVLPVEQAYDIRTRQPFTPEHL
ncbi:MAG: P-II family nitrogen regulator [Acidobacteriota bacterium]|nr:P-II family nitrogen regulator [Acidobacteriota bacterium]